MARAQSPWEKPKPREELICANDWCNNLATGYVCVIDRFRMTYFAEVCTTCANAWIEKGLKVKLVRSIEQPKE